MMFYGVKSPDWEWSVKKRADDPHNHPLPRDSLVVLNYFFSSMPVVGPPSFFIKQQETSVLPHILQV